MAKNTRQNLVDAGAQLFADVGYETTSVADLEKAAGLTPRAGGFYRHFKSKEELLIELVDVKVETPEKLGLDKIMPLGDTRAELIHIARSYERLNQSGGALTQVIHAEAGRIPQLAKRLQRANTVLFDGLLMWLSNKPRTGALAASQVGELVYIVFGGWLFFLGRQEQLSIDARPNSELLLTNWATHWANYLEQRS